MENLNENDNNRIITAIRVRPLSSNELLEKRNLIVSLGKNNDHDIQIINPKYLNQNEKEKERTINEKDKVINERQFSYDYIFWSIRNTTSSNGTPNDIPFYDQLDIYVKVGKPIIVNCLNGLNCSLFAYGKVDIFFSLFSLFFRCNLRYLLNYFISYY